MRTEFIYSFMALGAIPVVANAADVQTISSDVLASTDGSEVKYSVGKLVPGKYKFEANIVSKVYGVNVTIGGKTGSVAGGVSQALPVSVEFELTEETDVELTLVSTDPGQSGAEFTVSGAKVILDYNFATIKSSLANSANELAAKIRNDYNYAAKEEDATAADALETKANNVKETYDDYKTFELYAEKSTIQKEIDALTNKAATAEAEYQNDEAYDRVNNALNDIKGVYNAAVTAIEGKLVGVALYLLDGAKADLDAINDRINKCYGDSYKSHQAKTAVATEATIKADIPTPQEIQDIVDDWTAQADDNIAGYATLEAIVKGLKDQLKAIVPNEAIASQFDEDFAAANEAIGVVEAKVKAAENSAAQLNANLVATEEDAAQTKINDLKTKVGVANAEYDANEATLTALNTLQTNLQNAITAVNKLKSTDGQYKAEDYYDDYVAAINTAIEDLRTDAAKAYDDGKAQEFKADENTKKALKDIQIDIDYYAGTTEPAKDGYPKQAVDKYNDLQTAMASYKDQLDDARAQVKDLAVYNDNTYDYKTKFDKIQKRINDIKKAIEAAQEKRGEEHWDAMLAIDADAAITQDIKNLLSQVQSDQNAYDAAALATGIKDLSDRIETFNGKAENDAVFGDDFATFAAAEGEIEADFNAVLAAKNAIDANSETVDYTGKVGQDAADWSAASGNNYHRAKLGNGQVEHYEGSGSPVGDMLWQEVDVENGIYDIEVLATSHNANGCATLENDDNTVAYVFGKSGNSFKQTWITARKNNGFAEGEPETYAINGVQVENGKLTIGLHVDKAGKTNWHTIQIKSLKANTASLIQGWGAEIADLAAQQTALETAAKTPADKVAATNTAKTDLGNSIDGLQTTIANFKTTYKIGTDESTLGNKGKADGDITNDIKDIEDALTALEGENNAVDPTAVAEVDNTSSVGTQKGSWLTGINVSFWTNYQNNTLAGMDMVEHWADKAHKDEYTGDVLYQELTGIQNGLYDLELYADAVDQGDGNPNKGRTDIAYVYANEQQQPIAISDNVTHSVVYKFQVLVSDGKLRMGLYKAKPGTNWHAIQIKSLFYHENSQAEKYNTADKKGYNDRYSELATKVNEYVEGAQTIVDAVVNNDAYKANADDAVKALTDAELATLKSLKNVTDENAVSTDAVAKKADPADWKVFESGLAADKSYTAKKAAIDADITALSAAILASYENESLALDWKDNDNITVVVGKDEQQQEIKKTYSIATITQAINDLKTEAVAESDNYEAYKALQDNDMAKLLPDTVFTKLDGENPVAMTEAEIKELIGEGAYSYYTGLKTQYKNDKADILTRMQADLKARKAVSTKDAFVTEINALIPKVKVVKSDAVANYKKYQEQFADGKATQKLWNQTYTEIAATDESTLKQSWLEELDDIQTTLTTAKANVEANYPKGESVDKAEDFAAIKASINDVKARQQEGYNAQITEDNKDAHTTFIGGVLSDGKEVKGTIQLANEAYQRAVQGRAQYSSTNPDIKDAIDAAAANLDKALYEFPTKIEKLTKDENDAFVAVTSPEVFNVDPFNSKADEYEEDITAELTTFTTAVEAAIDGIWSPIEADATTQVEAAKNAIGSYKYISKDYKDNAFKDVDALIAKGRNGVTSKNLSEVEAAMAGLKNISSTLTAIKETAAQDDITAGSTLAENAYNDAKTYINGKTIVDDVNKVKKTQLDNLEKAYADAEEALESEPTFGNHDAIATALENVITVAETAKKAVDAAIVADQNNTTAYNDMVTTVIKPVEDKLTEAKTAAAPYKYATSFTTDEQNLTNLYDKALGYKTTGTAAEKESKDALKVDANNYSSNIEATLTTAFNTEKTGLSVDITELKNQFNAYVAANELNDEAKAFKKRIDDLDDALAAIAIVDADKPADGIQYDEILAATSTLVQLQNDIANLETELLNANASTVNATTLAEFNTKLEEMATDASLDDNDEWVGEQMYNGKKLSESAAELKKQIEDVQAAINAEPNISFYKDQYQKQIDDIEAALKPVADKIDELQSTFTANAEAVEALNTELDRLQGLVNDAKEKYQNAVSNYFWMIESTNLKGELVNGAQYAINREKANVESYDAVKNAQNYALNTSVTNTGTDIVTTVQRYKDKTAYSELTAQKEALTIDLTNAIDAKYKANTYSNALWSALIAEKSRINSEIGELASDIGESYKTYTYWSGDEELLKPCTSDLDYETQKATVDRIKAEIKDLSNLVDNVGMLGDANQDGRVNVLDYQKVLNMILDPSLLPDEDSNLFANININRKGGIEVGDLTAIVNYILTEQWTKGYAAARGDRMGTNESLSMNALSTGQSTQRFAVNLENAADYTAFQLDVVLPTGMKIVGCNLSDRAAESHKLYSRGQMDGSTRIVASSVKGESFSGNEGAVLYIDVETTSDYMGGNMELLNILFSDTNANTRSFTLGSDATGIDGMSTFESLKQKVYDLGGRVKNGVKKGINILRRADGSTQKVVK